MFQVDVRGSVKNDRLESTASLRRTDQSKAAMTKKTSVGMPTGTARKEPPTATAS